MGREQQCGAWLQRHISQTTGSGESLYYVSSTMCLLIGEAAPQRGQHCFCRIHESLRARHLLLSYPATSVIALTSVAYRMRIGTLS
jgi:hypothetical protein